MDISNFRLRRMVYSNSETIFKWRNMDHIRQNMYTDHIITKKEHLNWILRTLADNKKKYFIFTYKDKEIGLSCATGIEKDRCVWAYYLGEKTAPRGCGALLELLTINKIFTLGVDTITCEVFVFNKPVIKLHTKFGFKEMREFNVIKNGKKEKVLEMSLLRQDWLNIKPRIDSIFKKNDN